MTDDTRFADRRLGALASLAITLVAECGDLASLAAPHLDDAANAELRQFVDRVRDETRTRLGEIGAMGTESTV